MRHVRWFLVGTLTLVGCGGGSTAADAGAAPDDPTLTQTLPTEVRGTLAGDVLDSRLEPLAGVTVQVALTGLTDENGKALPSTATTDAAGHWMLAGIPAGGEVPLTIAKDGFATARLSGSVINSAGAEPQADAVGAVGPIVLSELNGTLKFVVLDAGGRAAKGAKATLEVSPAFTNLQSGGTYGAASGIVTATAVADDQGVLTFTGIPSAEEAARLGQGEGSFALTVQAYDADGDGVLEGAGQFASYGAKSLALDSTPRVVLLGEPGIGGPGGGFQVVSTNVPSITGITVPLQNFVGVNEAVSITFSRQLALPSCQAVVTDETGEQSVAVELHSDGATGLRLVPSAPLTAGREYNFSVHAVSLGTGATLDLMGFFFAGKANEPIAPQVTSVVFHDAGSPSNGLLNSSEFVEVTFNVPVGAWNDPNYAAFFINRDLDATGVIGDGFGEVGYTGSGFPIKPFEYSGGPGALLAPLPASGFSTRWYVFYTGGTNVQPGAQVVLDFDRTWSPTSYLTTVWNQPVTGQANLTLNAVSTPFP